jgi:hypothetical protein
MKEPKLKFRYAVGLGDIIACSLHSKAISWLTFLLTGKKKPCIKCSKRINALNVLAPISIWKLFFKDVEHYKQSYERDLQNYADYSNERKQFELQNILQKDKEVVNQQVIIPKIEPISGYRLISSSQEKIDGYLVRHQIYKLN